MGATLRLGIDDLATARDGEARVADDVTGVHRAIDRSALLDVAPPISTQAAAPATVHELGSPLTIVRGGVRLASFGADELRARFPLRWLPTHGTSRRFGVSPPVAWSAVQLCDVLEEIATSLRGVRHVSLISRDLASRAFEQLPIEHALDARTMLVLGMNDAPLPAIHGGPVRALVPFALGEKSVRWLTAIELGDGER